ncbi:sulfurtransferase complex subunit TusB [Vibrio astriarenae]|uniref:Sulfurtransferase complex subunit TusB n=1 Tax=Vibrio astriarenae TaxID=1481923 RepID=A0A7Z2YEQ3_9VIBR|nr:sulfurtransferase complex subunit TusB [Vibrio astriarenae]QIA64354.1 sulfurtransferase complex subunit TusB [Vibrio astriarenae]
MLFIVKTLSALTQAQALASHSDAVLLVENAVYSAVSQHHAFPQLKDMTVWVLSEDALARGIESRVSPSVQKVDFDGFVALTVQHEQSITLE